jgi:hypothetical protein
VRGILCRDRCPLYLTPGVRLSDACSRCSPGFASEINPVADMWGTASTGTWCSRLHSWCSLSFRQLNQLCR